MLVKTKSQSRCRERKRTETALVDGVTNGMDRLADRLADDRHRLHRVTRYAKWKCHHPTTAQERKNNQAKQEPHDKSSLSFMHAYRTSIMRVTLKTPNLRDWLGNDSPSNAPADPCVRPGMPRRSH